MKLFITGGTGFIGSHLIEKLTDLGHEITISLRIDRPKPESSRVNYFTIDESSISKTIDFFKKEKFDGVIHLASLYIKTHQAEDVFELINSNLRFSTHILESASRAGIKWFLNTGTFWQHFESKEYSPVNLYAATKQAFESIAQYYIETNQLQFVTIKLSDTYGPEDTRPKILNFLNKIAQSGDELDMSGGEQIMDISYIDDVVSAFAQLVNNLNSSTNNIKNGQVYGVTSNRLKLQDLVRIFEEVTNQKLKINWGVRPYANREVMTPWSECLKVPGWKPQVSIEEGIKRILIS